MIDLQKVAVFWGIIEFLVWYFVVFIIGTIASILLYDAIKKWRLRK